MEIKVRDLMNKQPATISSQTTIDEAVVALMNFKVPDLYVTNSQGSLVGVIPEYELLKLFLNGNAKATAVSQVMSGNLTTIRANYGIMQVAPLFRNSYLQRLAVVEDGKLIGELHRRDVIWLLATVDRILDGQDPAEAELPNRFEKASATQENFDEEKVEQKLLDANVPRPQFMKQQLRAGSRRRNRAESSEFGG